MCKDGIGKSVPRVGLPRLRNFVNVYRIPGIETIPFTRNYRTDFLNYRRSVKSPIFFLKKSSLKNVPCANIRNCLVRCCDRTHFK